MSTRRQSLRAALRERPVESASFIHHGAAAHSHGVSSGSCAGGVGLRGPEARRRRAAVRVATTGSYVRPCTSVRVLHLVDLPALRLGCRRGRGRSRRGAGRGCASAVRLRLVRLRHEVAHAEHPQVPHAAVEVVDRAVHEPAHRVRRLPRRGELADGEEVVVGRRRRLEVEAFHRADATVREVRQELERERRAVLVDLARRFPQRAPGGSLFIVCDDVAELGPRRLASYPS